MFHATQKKKNPRLRMLSVFQFKRGDSRLVPKRVFISAHGQICLELLFVGLRVLVFLRA